MVCERQRRYRARKKSTGCVRIDAWVPALWVAHVREHTSPSAYARWVLERLYEARQQRLMERAEREVHE